MKRSSIQYLISWYGCQVYTCGKILSKDVELLNKKTKEDNRMKEFFQLILGFIPWLLFMFIAGHSLFQLEMAILICLAASVVFGFRDLRERFILQWGSLIFFLGCAVLINGLTLIWFAENMDILANGYLAGLVWVSIMLKKPFTLQYARRDLPVDRWNDIHVVRVCTIIAVVWACLMTFSTIMSVIKHSAITHLADWVYFYISITNMILGAMFTVWYKRRARRQAAMYAQ